LRNTRCHVSRSELVSARYQNLLPRSGMIEIGPRRTETMLLLAGFSPARSSITTQLAVTHAPSAGTPCTGKRNWCGPFVALMWKTSYDTP
jgi:hypothetical protein